MDTIEKYYESQQREFSGKPDFARPVEELNRTTRSLLKAMDTLQHAFRWFDVEDDGERLCVLLGFGYTMYRGVYCNVRKIFEERHKLLCDEHCEQFCEWLCKLDNLSRKIIPFLKEAEKVFIRSMQKENALPGNFPELVEKYREYDHWSQTFPHEKGLAERVARKREIKRVNYRVHVSEAEQKGIRHYYYAMLDCLSKLSVPAHGDMPEEVYVPLFDNSFEAFKQGEYWKKLQKHYAMEMRRILTGLSPEEQLCALRFERGQLIKKITKDYLSRFDVHYCGIDDPENKGLLAKQLYERLNPDREPEKPEETAEAKARMGNEELCYYFALEAEAEYLTKYIEHMLQQPESQKEKEAEKEAAKPKEGNEKGGGKPFPRLFNSVIDPEQLESCLKELYLHFYGEERQEVLMLGKKKRCDEVTFVAYLYILVEREKLGNETFGVQTRQPFFNFIRAKVMKNLGKTPRTFQNRMADIETIRQKILKAGERDLKALGETNVHCRNFQQILNAFHGTRFAKNLKRSHKKGGT